MEATEVEPGATYRATGGKWAGWEGVACSPDTPAKERIYRVGDGHVIAVGPVPGDETSWTVYPVKEVDGDLVVGDPEMIDRGLLPLPWPRIGIIAIGPKGAPERRYFDAADLEEVA